MVEGARCVEDCEGVSRYCPCSIRRVSTGVLAVMGRAEERLTSGLDGACLCVLWGGGRIWALSALVLVAGRPALAGGLLSDCGLSSLEATRVMGGSCGG